MQRRASLAFGVCLVALASFGACAADAPSAAAAPPPPAGAASAALPEDSGVENATPRPAGGEPFVKRTVIDDGQARIEELRVRGNLQKVTVAPKHAPSYEVLTGEGWHETADNPGTSRGSAGKRVWNVLRF
jgi:hypothetical protein